MWQHIKDIVPLAQTALWIGLIVWIVNRYGGFIDQVLYLFRKRVESGSSVKAGPFEIGEAVEPQSLSDQKKEADEEIIESSEKFDTLSRRDKSSIRSEYFLIEDLALRAIQEQYGVSIQRNVKVLSLFEADGVFTKNGTLHVVEVKSGPLSKVKPIASNTLSRLDTLISSYGWKNVVIVFVMVIRDTKDENKTNLQTDIPIDNYNTKIQIHTYMEGELKAAVGID